MKLYPSNKEHFKKLIPFAKKIISICKDNGIEPVIYGSFAHFYYTKDKNMKVNDIDLMISREGLKKLIEILKENKIKFIRCSPDDYSLIIKKGKLKVELDEVGGGYKTLNDKSLSKNIFNKIDFYGVKVQMITLKHILEIYPVAYNRSRDDKARILKKIKHMERFLGREILVK